MVGKYETGSCRAPLLISIFTGTRIKNHAAINARCSNLIKPCVRSLQLGRRRRGEEDPWNVISTVFFIREHVEKEA